MGVPFFDLKKQYEGIREEVEPKMAEVLASCAYIGGKYVNDFQIQMSEYLGIKHVLGCASGTDALVLALRACGVGIDDEVITTPFTFFATGEAIAAVGAKPCFVDIRESDYNINPDLIEDAITEKTKAILPVHIFGACADMDAINAIARKHGLKVIEDCAQAIGATYKGRMAGTLGDIGCFSFYPTKNLGGCGDGGMVTTQDDDLMTILLALHEHGAGQNGAKAMNLLGGDVDCLETTEEVTEFYNPYKYYNYLIGYNSRLDGMQAAILSIKLRHLESYNESRKRIASKYRKELPADVVCPVYSEDIDCCYHQFVVRSNDKQGLCAYLTEHGIGNGTFYPVPLHQQKAFHNGNCVNAGATLPVAEQIACESVCLPIYPELTDEQVDEVINAIKDFYKK